MYEAHEEEELRGGPEGRREGSEYSECARIPD